MVKTLEKEIHMELPRDRNISDALLALVDADPAQRNQTLAVCTGCVACNNGGPGCVSCVAPRVYDNVKTGYATQENGYAKNNL